MTETKYVKESNDAPVIFHPNFLEGRAAYFHIMVSNSLQPLHIIKAAVKAGAAAEHAEARKDYCYEARVMAVGGEFYSFVVETYGFGLLQVCKR